MIYSDEDYLLTADGATTTYTYDSLNRLTAVNTSSRQIQYLYNGLGQRIGKIDNVVQGGQWKSVFRFTGQEYDAEYALYNYNARLYDPIMGRFISPDHIVQDYYDPQSLNRYSYTRNNPLTYVDPTGNQYETYDQNLWKSWTYSSYSNTAMSYNFSYQGTVSPSFSDSVINRASNNLMQQLVPSGARNWTKPYAEPSLSCLTHDPVVGAEIVRKEWRADGEGSADGRFDRFGGIYRSRRHLAVDLTAPLWTPIHAAGRGFISKIDYDADGWGYYIRIKHTSDVETLYGHLDRDVLVRKGDLVSVVK